jgi:leucyl/phenylalanyl-tRNA--protein transferase
VTALSPDLVLRAYAIGFFPMANDHADPVVHWVEPKRRGILPLDRFHLSRRLARTLRNGSFTTTADVAFDAVIRACAEPTPDRPKTWLNRELIELYSELHRLGHAHSVETWIDDRLVGGLYGVRLGSAFFGESMFSRVSDASKVALADLVWRLRRGGFTLLDTQFQTEHLASLGAIEIPRERYRQLLAAAVPRRAVFPRDIQSLGEVASGLRGLRIGNGGVSPRDGSDSAEGTAGGAAADGSTQAVNHTS